MKQNITKGLGKIILATTIPIAGLVCLTGCEPMENPANRPYVENKVKSEDTRSGIGMTYGGKLGYSPCDGVVIPFDGSGMTMGFGF